MNNEFALQISENRDAICEWVVERFRELIADNRTDDAICFADEWFEWLGAEMPRRAAQAGAEMPRRRLERAPRAAA